MNFIKNFCALFLKIIGFLLILFAFYSFINSTILIPFTSVPIYEENTDFFEAQKWELYGELYTSSIFFLISLVFTPKCFILAKKLSKRQIKKQELKYNEPFILYLRSFIDDKKSGNFVDPVLSGSKTEEEILVNILSEIAPVFCIGSPEDLYTPYGAQRIYIEEHNWKERVEEMAKYAKCIVLRLGETSNFWWEVEMCLQTINKDKLLFLIPFSNNFASIGILYKYLYDNGFATENYNVSISKASKGTISSFVYFETGQHLISKTLRINKLESFVISYENMIRNTLMEFKNRFGFETQKKSVIRTIALIHYLVILITLVYMIIFPHIIVFNLQHGF